MLQQHRVDTYHIDNISKRLIGLFSQTLQPLSFTNGYCQYAGCLSLWLLSDYFKGCKNYVFILSYFACVVFGSFLLTCQWNNLSIGFHILLYFIIGLTSSYGQPMIFSWINRHFVHDDIKRHFTVMVTNTIPYLTSTIHVIVWDTRDQPHFKLGFIYSVVLSVVGIFATVATLRFTTKRLTLRETVGIRHGSHGSLGNIEEDEILIGSSTTNGKQKG